MKDFTAGVYRQQREYKSFSPSFINCPFAWENRQINQLVEQAANLLGELNAYAEIVPDVDFSIPMSIAKEAIDSNLIEGTKTEIDEVVLPQTEIPPIRQDDWEEVQNYIAALNFAISELPRIRFRCDFLRMYIKYYSPVSVENIKRPAKFGEVKTGLVVHRFQTHFLFLLQRKNFQTF